MEWLSENQVRFGLVLVLGAIAGKGLVDVADDVGGLTERRVQLIGRMVISASSVSITLFAPA